MFIFFQQQCVQKILLLPFLCTQQYASSKLLYASFVVAA